MARKKPTPKSDCPVEDYARAVLEGRIIAGELVRLACQRHLDDLQHCAERGFCWDAAACEHILKFFRLSRLPAAGELDGKSFTPEPFQVFQIGSIFGWKKKDGARRFRKAYIEEGKGNGKTPFAACIGLYGLLADGEVCAEIYSTATTRDQAKILLRDAQRMAQASPAIAKRCKIDLHNIAHPASSSFFRAVSNEHRTASGPRPHFILHDELHEHRDSQMVDKMTAGIKRRQQPLILEITNSGSDRNSICWQHHEYSVQVLRGLVQDDSWFAYVCQLDPCAKCRAEGKDQPSGDCPDCDDWRDERVWPKANPGLDAILPREYLRGQVKEAVGMPAMEGIVRRLNFCCWTEVVTHAIPMDAWDACAAQSQEHDLDGRECYLGVDIGATSDFTCAALLFPEDEEEAIKVRVAPDTPEGPVLQEFFRRSYSLRLLSWLPEKPRRRSEQLQRVIDGWVREGLVKLTPGDVVDYDQVLRDLVALREVYQILEVSFDRGFQGCQFGTDLMTHFGDNCVFYVPQGILSMNPPFRELIELIRLKRIKHDGNKVLRWMASNCASEERSGLIKPSKDRSSEKIDGITAAVIALARAMLRPRGTMAQMGSW